MTLPGQPVDPNPPASLAAALTRAVAYPIFCLEITAGIQAFTWISTGGYYTYALGDGTGVMNDSVDEIVNLYFNGTALTQVFGIRDLVPGSWMWDYSNQRVAMIAPGSVDPKISGTVVELLAMYRFSDVPTDINSKRWRPWLISLPSLQNRVTTSFNGITQISGGQLVLQNESHFFDSKLRHNWDAGTCVLYMGASGLSWGQFQKLVTWTNSSAAMDDSDFTLNVQEAKVLLDAIFPSTIYNTNTYPNIDPNAIGSPVPLAYNVLHGIKPILIDQVNLVFQVASHPIVSFDGVRVLDKTTGVWVVKNFASTNTATAQFTMSPSDYAVGGDISVDISGMAKGNGQLMNNPADIIKDIITRLGQSVDSAGFTTAANWYDIGFDNTVAKNRVCTLSPSLYLNTQASALTTIEEVLSEVRAYLTSTPDGKFTMIPFRCYQVSALPLLNDNNVLEPDGFKLDGSGTSNFRVQAGSKITQAQVNFNIKPQDKTQESVTFNSLTNLYTRNLGNNVPSVVNSSFVNEKDAMYLAQALVNEYRVDPYILSCSVKWAAFRWRPGDHVHVVSARHNFDIVCEIIEVTIDLVKRKVSIVMNNLRGFYESSGFWVASGDLTPSGASLAWPTNGELSDPAETQYRRHQAGHWNGSNDFAMDVASASQPSDQDFAVSRWQ